MDNAIRGALVRDIMAVHMLTMIAFWRIYDSCVVTNEELEDTQSWQEYYPRTQGWEIKLWNKMIEGRN